MDYSTDGGITWSMLRTLDPSMLNEGPQTVSIELPDEAKSVSTVLRWWQPVISPGKICLVEYFGLVPATKRYYFHYHQFVCLQDYADTTGLTF